MQHAPHFVRPRSSPNGGVCVEREDDVVQRGIKGLNTIRKDVLAVEHLINSEFRINVRCIALLALVGIMHVEPVRVLNAEAHHHFAGQVLGLRIELLVPIHEGRGHVPDATVIYP